METEHTPGPWEIRYGNGIDMQIVSEQGSICRLDGYSHSVELMDENEEKERANARLIAAAPDLLEVCEAALMVGEIQFETCVLSKSVKERLIAAINKAKGL